jgi:hypothetical protein
MAEEDRKMNQLLRFLRCNIDLSHRWDQEMSRGFYEMFSSGNEVDGEIDLPFPSYGDVIEDLERELEYEAEKEKEDEEQAEEELYFDGYEDSDDSDDDSESEEDSESDHSDADSRYEPR